jgi:prolyl-tRNA editing enzyme YbaK/EbsC (Cys-tRNA(Pro) deacylase)
MKDALAIHRMLLAEEIRHEIVRLRHAVADADELPETLRAPARNCLATRIYTYRPRTGTRFLAAVITGAGVRPSPADVAYALGARMVRPAPADLVNKITDYVAGLVAPLLLPETVAVALDQRVIDSLGDDDTVYTATGEPRTALGIRALDLFTLCDAKPVDLVREITSQLE